MSDFKFKTGDRVRLAVYDVLCGHVTVGCVGTVIEESTVPFVRWDGLSKGHDAGKDDGRKDCWAMKETQMELAS